MRRFSPGDTIYVYNLMPVAYAIKLLEWSWNPFALFIYFFLSPDVSRFFQQLDTFTISSEVMVDSCVKGDEIYAQLNIE